MHARWWGLQGMRVRPEGPQLISEMLRKHLGIDCSVLMGANIAKARLHPDTPPAQSRHAASPSVRAS
jgi:hypothetical protein